MTNDYWSEYPAMAGKVPPTAASVVCVPMVVNGEIFGVLGLGAIQRYHFSPNFVGTVGSVVEQITPLLYQAWLASEWEQRAW